MSRLYAIPGDPEPVVTFESPLVQRVLVTGSRDWRNYSMVFGTLYGFGSGPLTVVHGAATGLDHMARSAALALGFDEEPHFPDYDKYPPNEAPKERNKLMVSLGADVCLAFPTKNSRGTYHCANLAKAAGIRVVWCGEPGTER